MQVQVCQYFNQFYQTVLKEHIQDAIIHSQWLYFLSMFKSGSLDKERIELYLGILATQKVKRDKKPKELEQVKSHITEAGKVWTDTKGKLNNSGQNQINFIDIKLDKRFSQNWKESPVTLPNKLSKQIKTMPEVIPLRRTTSIEDEPNRSLRSIQDESKNIRMKNQPLYAIPSCSPNSYAYLRPKSSNQLAVEREAKLKERNNKLVEISKKIVSVFERGKLRG